VNKLTNIPSDWRTMSLSDFGTFFKGQSVSKTYITNDGMPIIRYGDLYVQYKDANSVTHFAFFADPLVLKADKKLQFGDILFTGTGETQEDIGKCVAYLRNDEAYAGGDIIVFRPNSSEINSELLAYTLNTGEVLNTKQRLGQGLSIFHIYSHQLEKLKIPLPPFKEQQKIAEILSTVDEQISTIQAIIDKSKELKKGLMQKLFSEGIGHTDFKDTKIGRIPKDWEVDKIGKVADCYGGTTPSTTVEEYWNGDILWATPSDITKNNSEYLLSTDRKITEKGRASKNLRYVQKNGLLMTSRASIGFLNISNGDVVTNQGFINIECKNTYHFKFFYYWIINNRNLLVRYSQGSTFLELYRKTFSKINIPTPPLPEQKKIAEILSEADAKIEKEEHEKAKLEELKKGLMQQLLTGKKRVKV
jgi:type I restriction enzyme, S subunit